MRQKITLLTKTLLLLCALVAGSVSGWATDVTFTAGTDKGTNGTSGNSDTMTKDGITISGTSFATTTAQYRIYSNSTLTISSTVGTISKIVITSTANKGSDYGPDKISATGYTTSTGSKIGTWSGSATSVQFSASAQCRASSIVVTYTPSGEANSITAIADQNVDLYGSITLTPQSSNGTTGFTFSTTSDAILLTAAADGKSCLVEGLEVTGSTPAVVTINQAAGTHNGTNYMAASTTVNVNVIDNRTVPEITLSNVPTELNTDDEQTVTVTTLSTGTRSVASSNDDILMADIDTDGNIYLIAGEGGEVTITLTVEGTTTYKSATKSFTVTVDDGRVAPTFSFANSSVEVEWDERESFTAPTLNNNSDGTLSYTSSNTAVATVNASTGAVTFVGGGTTVITASVTGSSSYLDAEASYTLTVNKPYSFTETFDNASFSSNKLTNTDNSGWDNNSASYSETVDEHKCIRLASGSADGYITTPALTGIPEKALMTFDARSFGSDSGVSLSISGSDCTVSPSSISLTNTFTTYKVVITKTGDSPKITFTAVTKKRAYVDNVNITDIPYATISIADAEVKAGKTATLSITTNSTGAFSFVSSDDDIAAVAKVGDDYVVTGVAEGTTTITATQAATDFYKATTTTFDVTVISASTAVAPTFTVADGETVEIGSTITIETEENCTIKYTTDNSDPKTSATATTTLTNSEVITIPTGISSLTLRAVTINGENVSEETSATYTVVKKTLTASFAAASISVAIGADADEPALTNPSGGTVTWESSDTDVVTVDENGQLAAIAEGTATITANIAATDTYLAGSVSYTVNVFDPTTITISFTNNTFGLSSNKQEGNYSLSYNGLTFVFDKGTNSQNSPRVDGGSTSPKYGRIYNGNTMTVQAPSGYGVSKIVFNFNKGSLAIDGTSYSSSKTTWTGLKTEVEMGCSETTWVNSMTISITPCTAVTISTADYATFSNASATDFSESGITVYKAKVENNVVKMTEVSNGIVPANTGVILYKDVDEAEDIAVPFTTTNATLSDNELVATVTRTQVAKTDGMNFNYILQSDGEGGIVFNMAAAGGAYMPAGKAYLSTTVDASASGSARLSVVFADDTEGIAQIENESVKMDGVAYDLQGRRVAKPTVKGLYIVNGKKTLVK